MSSHVTKTTRRAAAWSLGLCAALLAGLGAQAGVALNAARVGAVDVPALARFYETAFGLQEVNRLERPGHLEVMLNFGDSVAAAKANPAAQIVIMHRDSDDLKDEVPHMILTVTDLAATAAAITAAGGTIQGKPIPFGKSGMLIGFAADPVGNRLELIQQPQPAGHAP
jgi:predicted enzyme related to lactoylglutathione lyase